jgi:hypothetical protein
VCSFDVSVTEPHCRLEPRWRLHAPPPPPSWRAPTRRRRRPRGGSRTRCRGPRWGCGASWRSALRRRSARGRRWRRRWRRRRWPGRARCEQRCGPHWRNSPSTRRPCRLRYQVCRCVCLIRHAPLHCIAPPRIFPSGWSCVEGQAAGKAWWFQQTVVTDCRPSDRASGPPFSAQSSALKACGPHGQTCKGTTHAAERGYHCTVCKREGCYQLRASDTAVYTSPCSPRSCLPPEGCSVRFARQSPLDSLGTQAGFEPATERV